MPEILKINWILKNVIVREDLDLTSHTGDRFLAWKRQFLNFYRESGAEQTAIDWEAKYAALEACVCPGTFQRIEALRLQLPVQERQNMISILKAVTEIAGVATNIWLQRHKFSELKQTADQSFQQFYTELVTIISLCKFDEGICNDDKQRVLDLMLLNKIVFGLADCEVRKKLFEIKELDLTQAIKIIETHEELHKTDKAFNLARHENSIMTSQNSSREINRIGKNNAQFDLKAKKLFKEKTFAQTCSKCGYKHENLSKCPAQGKICNYCGTIGHFKRMCRKKKNELLNDRNARFDYKKSGAIITNVKTNTETVNVQVHTAIGGDHVVKFMIDTGSDWTVLSLNDLTMIRLTIQNLVQPTPEMNNTITATGKI